MSTNLSAQDLDPITRWATVASTELRVFPDHEKSPLAGSGFVYRRANNIDLKLDVITAGPETEVRPTVIYFHGGGWVHLAKEDRIFYVLPYLARGMNAVNVEYRLANQSLAPAAVEDCRCSLRWVYRHANEFGLDTHKLVVIGESAGGHLALMTGMVDSSAGFDDSCARSLGEEAIGVTVMVNYFGITDVADLLEGTNRRPWAVEWFGSLPNRAELARRLSPLTYVRKGIPPIITIHGTSDAAVPYQHAERLHAALDHLGVLNRLVTIPGGGHGQRRFSREENIRAQTAIFQFLEQCGVSGVIPRDLR
jgi:acetyl esterase/lipase